MRSAIVSLLVATLAAAGCNRTNAAAATRDNPVGTVGKADPVPANAGSDAAATSAAPLGEARTGAERDITIPAGTRLRVILDTAVGSDTSRVEQRVSAHLARPLLIGGATVLPAGARVAGVVTDATRSAKVKGRAHVAMQFDSLSPHGEDRYAIRTSPVGRTAEATKRKDALEIGAPAAGGAVIGALVGGKKGALVGGAVGGGAGTAVVLSTRGKEVHMPKGTALTLKLAAPVTVKVRT